MKSKKTNVVQHHQEKIALATLKMTPVMAMVMEGMTMEEAETFLRSIGYTEKEIQKLKG